MSIHFVFAMNLFQGLSSRATHVVLVLYAVELGAQPLTVGFLAAMFSVFPMLLAVPAGRLADRIGAHWLLVSGATVAALGMILPYASPSLTTIFIAAALSGLQIVQYNVCLQNLVGLLSDAGSRARNFSNYSLVGTIGDLVGPLIAGFAIDVVGHGAVCLGFALSWLAPLAWLSYRGPRAEVLSHGLTQLADTRQRGGVGSLLAERDIARTLAVSSMLSTGTNLFKIYLPVYAHAVGLSASAIGLVLSISAAAEFVAQMMLPRIIKRSNEQRVLAFTLCVGAASLALIPFLRSTQTLAFACFIFGMGTGCGGPIINMLMFQNAPKGRSAESLGLKITVNHLTKVVSPVAFGVLGSAFGLNPMFWLNALMLAASGVLSHPKERRRG
jgi:MFS family permease